MLHLHPVARTAMRRFSGAALIVFATIIGLDLVTDVGATTYDDNGLAAAILDDVLLVTMPLVKKYEMTVIKQDEMSRTVFSSSSAQFKRASIGRPSPEATKMGHRANFMEFLRTEITKRMGGSSRRRRQTVLAFPANVTGFHHGVPPECDLENAPDESDCSSPYHGRYRTFSGRCNNRRKPLFGKHTVTLKRHFHPEYDDGVSSPKVRGGRTGNRLPNPRLVSNVVHKDKKKADIRHTLMLMQWGQLVDHDITLTPMIRGKRNTIIDCSACNSAAYNRACDPIPIPPEDKFFPPTTGRNAESKCIPFTRSLPGQSSHRQLREQLNQNTAFIDASHLYGSDPCRARDLRVLEGGRMRIMRHPGSRVFKDLMPRTRQNPECDSAIGRCFHTGDGRNNEQPGLTALHTVLLREHNRLADQLVAINPHWDDERTFQEARRIVMAINQHITYSEFLPRVLGAEYVNFFGLSTQKNGHSKVYNERCRPDIYNSFATAAFRFGHSLIKPMFRLVSSSRQNGSDEIRLRDHFNNPDVLFSTHFIDHLALGLLTTPMENFDAGISEELTNHLFEEIGRPYSGMDLVSLNIRRGRDHGLADYTRYLRICRKVVTEGRIDGEIDDFQDLKDVMTEESVMRLEDVYTDVSDIDLFSGGISEEPVKGGIVGPTFACLIANQFRKLKRCDRFWYETGDEGIRFTKEQLAEIRKITLSALVCRNCDIGEMSVQRSSFDMPTKSNRGENPMLPCTTANHPTVDVVHWREEGNAPPQSSSPRLPKSSESPPPPGPPCDFGGRIGLRGGPRVRVSACTECRCLVGGGGECETVRVKSCDKLYADVGKEAVDVDASCSAQCRPTP